MPDDNDKKILAETEARLSGGSKTQLNDATDSLMQYLRLYKSANIISAITGLQNINTADEVNSSIMSSILSSNNSLQAAIDTLLSLTTVQTPTKESQEEAANALDKRKGDKGTSDQKPAPDVNAIAAHIINHTTASDGPLIGAKNEFGESFTKIHTLAIQNSGVGINFSNRGSDYVAIFANLIPSTEFSQCVPYFRINFIQNIPGDTTGMPFLNLESFLGSAKQKVKGSAGMMSSVPNAFGGLPSQVLGAKVGNTVSGMELFLAPQTVINPDINSNATYAATRGIRVLDPMQPLASIDSINIDVSAVSQNFMATQSKIDLGLVLHDRSRLSEISPLVSPSAYPTVKAEIEWGWSHPDDNPFTTNVYAKFLNALRIKQLFAISSASLSNRDSTSMTVKIQLTGLGEFTMKSTSILTGDYVSYELVRAQVNQVINLFAKKTPNAPDGAKEKPALIYIGADETPIKVENWDTSDKWVPVSTYAKIVKAVEKAQNKQDITALKEELTSLIKNPDAWTTSAAQKSDTSLNVNQGQIRTAIETGLDVSSGFPNYDSSDFVQMYKNKPLDPVLSKADLNMQLALGSTDDKAASDANKNIGALGDVIYRLFTVPLAIANIYDEIRVTFFDFNDHAAEMSGVNIGAFPVSLADMRYALSKNMSVFTAMSKILSFTGRASSPAYGLQQALLDQKRDSEELAKLQADDADKDEDDAAAYKATREKIQRDFDTAIENIYVARRNAGIAVTYETKFTVPRIKFHTEVSNFIDSETKEVKNMLNVFIYDEANSGYRSVNILNAAITSRTGNLTTIAPSSEGGFTAEKIGPNKYTVKTDREYAKSLITSIMPTIRIGSEGSVITNASYSSATSGDIANINILSGIKNQLGNATVDTSPGIDADLFVIPGNLSVTMLGMPLVNRGQTYYFDFGTGTTLDNTYTVTSVKHSIKNGQFTTSVNLNITNQGSIRTVTSLLARDLGVISKYVEKSTVDVTSINTTAPSPVTTA